MSFASTTELPCMHAYKVISQLSSLDESNCCSSDLSCGGQGPRAWEWRYYKFRARAFSPSSVRLETCEATDPYSRSLAADGARSQARPALLLCTQKW